jgi:hypothetical protein
MEIQPERTHTKDIQWEINTFPASTARKVKLLLPSVNIATMTWFNNNSIIRRKHKHANFRSFGPNSFLCLFFIYIPVHGENGGGNGIYCSIVLSLGLVLAVTVKQYGVANTGRRKVTQDNNKSFFTWDRKKLNLRWMEKHAEQREGGGGGGCVKRKVERGLEGIGSKPNCITDPRLLEVGFIVTKDWNEVSWGKWTKKIILGGNLCRGGLISSFLRVTVAGEKSEDWKIRHQPSSSETQVKTYFHY